MKIITSIPNMENATSMYRGFAPLQELPKLDRQIEIIYPERTYIPNFDNSPCLQKIGFSFLSAKGADLIYCLRPVTPEHMGRFTWADLYNMPIVTDWDDNLLELPHWCETHKGLSHMDYHANIQRALRSSKHVTVSTQTIKNCFSIYTDKITVIRNAFDDYCYKLVEKRNNNKIVLWRGSSTHFRDLGLFKQELLKLIFDNPDFQFCFWSDELPTWITDLEFETTNVYIKPTVHPFEYHDHLKRMQPDLVIVPLEDNNLNRNKSDIAKLEATSVGALCISPDWHEWNWNEKDKTYFYHDKISFCINVYQMLERLRKQDPQLDEDYQANLQHIKDNRLLSQANKKRLEVFKDVINPQSPHS